MRPLRLELPQLKDFPESERTASLEVVLGICNKLLAQQDSILALQSEQLGLQSEQLVLQSEQLELQSEQLVLQSEQIQCLKDEVAILKGEKGRPKIKPGNLEKDRDKKDGDGSGQGGASRRGKPGQKKTAELEIHDTIIIQPDFIPPGAVFKGYEDVVVQDIEIKLKNIKYRRARYDILGGGSVIGQLPLSVRDTHFGPVLQAYILSQYYQQHVPQNLILKQLSEFGVCISSGQINNIIIEGHSRFHEEKAAILQAGLAVSTHINTDDTGARHKGQNGYCTHIGNELFAWFASTGSKSRVNFLELLRAGHRDYVLDDVALDYMKNQKLPAGVSELLTGDLIFPDETSFKIYLKSLAVLSQHQQRIITEGALLGSVMSHGISPDLVIISDDAGQFNVLGLLHALCWIHAERTIKKIIPFTDSNRTAQTELREQIWKFYQELKQYKITPSLEAKSAHSARFDQIFSQKTCFQSLNLALERIHKNKTELLLVLDRPEIPLHNNLSENDIRDYVKKRKISPTTRSDTGQQARDTFLSLKKTCQKLGISFWRYLLDRVSQDNLIKPLNELIYIKAATARA